MGNGWVIKCIETCVCAILAKEAIEKKAISFHCPGETTATSN